MFLWHDLIIEVFSVEEVFPCLNKPLAFHLVLPPWADYPLLNHIFRDGQSKFVFQHSSKYLFQMSVIRTKEEDLH